MSHTQGKMQHEGSTIYMLMHDGWKQGVERFRNKITAFISVDSTCQKDESKQVARRLAACWDACDGVRIEDIEGLAKIGHGVASLIVYGDDTKKQRDELLEAAKKAIRSLNELVVDDSEKAPAIQGARMRKQNAVRALGAAIQKAEGKA